MASSLNPEDEELAQIHNLELLATICKAFPMTDTERGDYMKILRQRKDDLLRIFLEYMADQCSKGATLDELKTKICRIQQMAKKAFFEMVPKLQRQACCEDTCKSGTSPSPRSDVGACHVRVLRHQLPDLRAQLRLGRTDLMDAMIGQNMMTDDDRQRIMAITSEPRRNEAFIDFLCANLSPETFKYIFIPLLLNDGMNSDIAQTLLQLIRTAEASTATTTCTFCQVKTQNVLGKLADTLYERNAISKAVKTDLQKSALTSEAKWQLLVENVQEVEFMMAMESAYRHIYNMYLETGHSALVCSCSRNESGGQGLPKEDCDRGITPELRERARNQTADIIIQILRQSGFSADICEQMRLVLLDVILKFHEHYMAFLKIVINSSTSAADVLAKNNYMLDIIITSLRQEISEQAPGRPALITLDTMKDVRKLFSELSTDLNLEAMFFHRMYEKGMITDSETDSILAHPLNKEKIESFLEFLTVRHTEESFRAQVLPLLCQDGVNQQIAQKIQLVFDSPRNAPKETRCTHCQLVGLGITRKLSQCMLHHGLITESVRGDLCNPGIPTRSKWQLIKEHMNEENMIQIVKETFPIQARLIELRNEALLTCCCDVANSKDFDSTASLPTGTTGGSVSVDDRLRNIVGKHFKDCCVLVRRLGENSHQFGPNGGTLQSSLLPQVHLTIPAGTLAQMTTVSLHVEQIPSDSENVSPIVTLDGVKEGLEGLSLTLPVPFAILPYIYGQGQGHPTRSVHLVVFRKAVSGVTCEKIPVVGPCTTIPVGGPATYLLLCASSDNEAQTTARRIQCHIVEKESADQYVVSVTALGQGHAEESMSVITEQTESTGMMECEEEHH